MASASLSRLITYIRSLDRISTTHAGIEYLEVAQDLAVARCFNLDWVCKCHPHSPARGLQLYCVNSH